MSSRSDADLVIEFEPFAAMQSLPAAGIRVLAPAGAERPRAPVEREEGAAPNGGEVSRPEDGRAESRSGDAMARWRSAPQRAQAPPPGEERQAGAEPAVELPDREQGQREE